MLVYYFLIFEILVLGLLLHKKKISPKAFCIIISLSIFVVSGFRANDVGGDTWNYFNKFYYLKGMSFQGALRTASWDVGYTVFEYVILHTLRNFQWVLIICAGLFSYSLGRFIYKYSEDPCLSFITVFAFNIFQFSVTGIRQTMAMSFGLFAITYYKEKKMMKAFIMLLIGATLHASCLVLLIIPIVKALMKSRSSVSVAIILLGVTFLLKARITALLIPLLAERGYQVSSVFEGGVTTSIVVFLLVLVLRIFYTNYSTRFPKDVSLDSTMLIMTSFFEILVPIQNIFFRLAFYFLVVLTIYIPRLISGIKDDATRNIMRYVMYGGLLYMYFKYTAGSVQGAAFHFFWK